MCCYENFGQGPIKMSVNYVQFNSVQQVNPILAGLFFCQSGLLYLHTCNDATVSSNDQDFCHGRPTHGYWGILSSLASDILVHFKAKKILNIYKFYKS